MTWIVQVSSKFDNHTILFWTPKKILLEPSQSKTWATWGWRNRGGSHEQYLPLAPCVQLLLREGCCWTWHAPYHCCHEHEWPCPRWPSFCWACHQVSLWSWKQQSSSHHKAVRHRWLNALNMTGSFEHCHNEYHLIFWHYISALELKNITQRPAQ